MVILPVLMYFTFQLSFGSDNVSQPVKVIELSQEIHTLYHSPCNNTYLVTLRLVQYLWEFRNIQKLCKDGNNEGKRLVEAVKDSGGPIIMRLPPWHLLNEFYPFDDFEKKEIELCYDHIKSIWNELKYLV